MTKLQVIVPCYNASDYIAECLRSIANQTHREFTVTVIDDASTDNTAEIAASLTKQDSRFSVYKTSSNNGALASIAKGINLSKAHPEDIIAIVDGDDLVISVDAFQIVLGTYQRSDCWITYGSFKTASGREIIPGIGKRYPNRVIDRSAYRSFPWIASHMRTYKLWLWEKIAHKDLLDQSGNYWKAAGDLAAMFPMLEMAGQRQEAISDIIYGYRDNIASNDHVMHRDLQRSCKQSIRQMPAYSLITDK